MGEIMIRRLFSKPVLLLSVVAALVLSACADFPTDYDVREVNLMSQGDKRAFYQVVTGERRLSMAQADELCQDLGYDYAVGTDSYREGGERLTDVVCADDDPMTTPTFT